MAKTIKVAFIRTEGEDELYKLNGSKNKIYVRQRTPDGKRVVWATATTWNQGYEPDAPLRHGITVRVISRFRLKRHTHFDETMVVDDAGNVSAEKKGLFFDELLAKTAQSYADEKSMCNYDSWKQWLLDEADRCGYAGYLDNWMYFATDEVSRKKLDTVRLLGIPYSLEESEWYHRFCKKTWKALELKDSGGNTAAICGYLFEP